jgi:hypothetical protein
MGRRRPGKTVVAFIVLLAIGLAVVWRVGLLEHGVVSADILLSSLFYSKVVENDGKLELSGDEVLIIRDTLYIQKNDVVLRDGARLIIEDSYFRFLSPQPLSLSLEARGASQVIIRDSKIWTGDQMVWQISDAGRLVMENTVTHGSFWIVCGGYSTECYVRNVSEFRGTVSENALLEVSDTPRGFIELAESETAFVKESFPARVDVYEFPNQDDFGVPYRLRVKNVESIRWGVNLPLKEGDITLINTSLGGVGIHFFPPYFEGETIELSGLRGVFYRDRAWRMGDIGIRLVNTSVEAWYMYAGGGNYVIVRDADISDNILSRDRARFLYENVSIGLVRAQDEVEITLKDSRAHDDIIARDNSRVILINTVLDWDNDVIEEDNGSVVIVDAAG